MINILDQYLHPHRHYHTIEHIAKMVRNSIVYDLDEVDRMKLKYGIYYHDFIYNPMSDTNEADSVTAFMDDLMNNRINLEGIMKPAELGASVMLMIQDTYDHIPRTPLSKLLIDLDLWELADPEQYIKNSKLIRLEYPLVHDVDFYKGRVNWITEMLNKDQIYYTNYCMMEDFEKKARANLSNELMELTNPMWYLP